MSDKNKSWVFYKGAWYSSKQKLNFATGAKKRAPSKRYTSGHCDVCDKHFARLDQHVKLVHDKITQQCPECGNMYSSMYLPEHARIMHASATAASYRDAAAASTSKAGASKRLLAVADNIDAAAAAKKKKL